MANSRYKNVFILCTGRCGSKTFIQACKHIQNYTAGHETNITANWRILQQRILYPEYHIEADNRLSFFLGTLNHYYTKEEVFYVHLTRRENDVIRSFAKRHGTRSLTDNFIRGILYQQNPKSGNKSVLIQMMVRSIKHNIENFILRNNMNGMGFPIEYAKTLFPSFCDKIGAEVDIQKALAEFDKQYNSSEM